MKSLAYVILISSLTVACQRGDSAKDREIAALREKVDRLSAPLMPAPPPDMRPGADDEPASPMDMLMLSVRMALSDKPQMREAGARVFESIPFKGDLTYGRLVKEAPRLYGLVVGPLTVRVLEIHEDADEDVTFGRISLSDHRNEEMSFFYPGTDLPYVARDVVDCIGVVAGNHTYESQAHWTITLPAIVIYQCGKRGTVKRPTPRKPTGTIAR